MVFFGFDDEHLHHLMIVFQRCRNFGIALNPKKSVFAMDESKLLGHIISKDSICTDPSRVEATQHIDFPHRKRRFRHSMVS